MSSAEKPNRHVVCKTCGKDFMAIRKTRKFCSSWCAYQNRYVYKGRKKGRYVPCALCGVDVWTRPRTLKTYKLRFCSKKHNIEYLKLNAGKFPCVVCGKIVFTQPIQLGFRKTCSMECLKVWRRRKAESKRELFGYTKHQLDRLARYSPEMDVWRMSVFERDDYTCQICHVRGTYIEADHIKPFAYFPELRYVLSNGRTLCRKCHDKTKLSAKRMREIYGK